MHTFGYEGYVEGMYIITITFDEAQLAITADPIMPGMIGCVQQLLIDEHTVVTLDPFFAGDANIWTTKTRGCLLPF
jgi:hypothetical protein